ncbi:RidA family protein [Halalkalibacter kiskunsagensis]|uniref:RidA family protein n=1 Tax=Halalkalibacter kiskunsagensis TaxID=1548599 RepID=A0ABV6KDQ4_9BACI
MNTVEQKLIDLGIELPEAPKPAAIYVPSKSFGNLVYVSGQDCRVNNILKYTGKVGSDLTLEEGYDAARQTIINALAVLKEQIGEFDRVKQVVKLLALVNSAEGFVEQPYVINGASELLVKVFGEERGSHARSAIGSNELPFNTPVEIEMIVEVE